MKRRDSITSDSRHKSKSPILSSNTRKLSIQNNGEGNPGKKLVRQNTFVLDGRASSENGANTSAHGGIEATFDLLPDNLKPYVSAHFRMIKEENEDLSKENKEEPTKGKKKSKQTKLL